MRRVTRQTGWNSAPRAWVDLDGRMLQLAVPEEVRDMLAAGRRVGVGILKYAERLTICYQEFNSAFPGNPLAYFHRLWDLSERSYIRDEVRGMRSVQLKGLMPQIWAARYAQRRKYKIGKLTTVYDFIRMIEAYLANEKQFDAVPQIPRWYDNLTRRFTSKPTDNCMSMGLVLRLWYEMFRQPDFHLERLDVSKLNESKRVEVQEEYGEWLTRRVRTTVHDNITLLNPYLPAGTSVFQPTAPEPLMDGAPVQQELPLVYPDTMPPETEEAGSAEPNAPESAPVQEPVPVPPATMNDAIGLHVDPLEADPSAKVSFTIDYLPFTRAQLEAFCDEIAAELTGMRCSVEVVAAHSLEVSMHIHTAWPVSEHTDENGIAKLLTVVDVVHAMLRARHALLEATERLNGIRQ